MPRRFFVVLAALWMVAMTARLYPQFKDAIRVDGRLSTVADYVADACGDRVGPASVTCVGMHGAQAQRLLQREQAKSVFAIIAPLLGYLLVSGAALAWAAWRRRIGGRRGIFPTL